MGLRFLDNTYDIQRKNLLKMLNLLDDLKKYADNGPITLAQDIKDKLVRAAQNFAMYTRELPNSIPTENPKAYLRSVYDDTFNITVEITPEGWLRIKMPPLLQRENGTPWFIREPLNAKLDEFYFNYEKEHGKKPPFFENGVMI